MKKNIKNVAAKPVMVGDGLGANIYAASRGAVRSTH